MIIKSKYGEVFVNENGKIDFNKSKFGMLELTRFLANGREIDRVTKIAKLQREIVAHIFREYEQETWIGARNQEVKYVPTFVEFAANNLMVTNIPRVVINGQTVKISYRTFSPATADATLVSIGISYEIL